MIEKTPTVTLATKEETFAWLAGNDETFQDKYSVKSEWLMDELDRFAADGFVYNREACDRIKREHDLSNNEAERRVIGKMGTESGLLGALVYNAQNYRRVRSLMRQGWQRATQETLAPWLGKKVRTIANGELTGETLAKVKQHEGRFRLAPARTRTKLFVEYQDWWIAPVSQGDAIGVSKNSVVKMEAA